MQGADEQPGLAESLGVYAALVVIGGLAASWSFAALSLRGGGRPRRRDDDDRAAVRGVRRGGLRGGQGAPPGPRSGQTTPAPGDLPPGPWRAVPSDRPWGHDRRPRAGLPCSPARYPARAGRGARARAPADGGAIVSGAVAVTPPAPAMAGDTASHSGRAGGGVAEWRRAEAGRLAGRVKSPGAAGAEDSGLPPRTTGGGRKEAPDNGTWS